MKRFSRPLTPELKPKIVNLKLPLAADFDAEIRKIGSVVDDAAGNYASLPGTCKYF